VILLFLSHISFSIAYTQLSDAISNASLSGLSMFQVLVGELNPEVQKDGLRSEQLRTDVELKLRIAGLRIIPNLIWVDTLGAAQLYIEVNTLKSKTIQYVYWIKINVIQKVSLIRKTSGETLANTWSIPVMGVVGSNNIVGTIREEIGKGIDKFINSYLSANPLIDK
jgi:hypothetical protein